jgi:acetoin utilization deacetylase AcuC-like enzyme
MEMEVSDASETPERGNNRIKNSSVIVVYNSDHINHKTKLTSPENPRRLTSILNFVKHESNLYRLGIRLLTRFRSARLKDLLRVHSQGLIDKVIKSSETEGFFEDSTYFTPNTFTVAMKAAGGAIEAGRRVVNGNCKYAFAAIRPPGHHSSRDQFGGFCIFNNAAILARYLQEVKGLKKIMSKRYHGYIL